MKIRGKGIRHFHSHGLGESVGAKVHALLINKGDQTIEDMAFVGFDGCAVQAANELAILLDY